MAPFSWSKDAEGEAITYLLSGRVDESSDFEPLLRELKDEVIFDLAGIERINSSGVLRWGRFIREVSQRVQDLRFVRCSPVIVSQLNMIKDFSGKAAIESFYAPYVCEECGAESTALLDVTKDREQLETRRVPSRRCDECGHDMVLNSLEDSYLGFLDQEPGEA